MGIKDLLSQLSKRYKEHGLKHENVFLEKFAGHSFAIDVSIYAHTFMAVSRKEAVKYINVLREDPNHAIMRSYWLERYFDMMVALLECNITPIAVFDGPHFELKQKTKEERSDRYQARTDEIKKLREELQQNDDPTKLANLRRKLEHHITFQKDDWVLLEEMFRTMGIPVVKPDTEAEAVCARLVQRGYATAVVTKDGDALAHLSPFMISKITRSYRQSKPWHTCTVYVLDEITQALELSRSQFVDFCMLLGTDYNERIRGYGFVNALKFLKQGGDLDTTLEIIRKRVETYNAKQVKAEKLDRVIDLDSYRLFDPDVRCQIRDYFTKPLNVKVEHFPVVLYENGLQSFVADTFMGPNRERLLGQIPQKIELLKSFNQLYAQAQIFVLQPKTEDNGK